jgi:GNAT superfamily N-acetyltransferase
MTRSLQAIGADDTLASRFLLPDWGLVATTTRPADAGDAAGIANLLAQLGYPTSIDDVLVRLQYWSADQRSKVVVAEADGALAGMAAVHAIPYIEHTGCRGRLVALVVDRQYRTRGVGHALIAAAEAEARVLGCLDMEITSARDRTTAHAFYVSAGYEDICGRAARFLKQLSGSPQGAHAATENRDAEDSRAAAQRGMDHDDADDEAGRDLQRSWSHSHELGGHA